MPDSLILQQLQAVVDGRTTMVCLRAAGQIQPVGHPFDTLMGELDSPPFHSHCRSLVKVWMPGFVSDQKRLANAEIMERPAKQRRFGPEGYGGSLPPRAGGVVRAPVPVGADVEGLVGQTLRDSRFDWAAADVEGRKAWKADLAARREAFASTSATAAEVTEFVTRWSDGAMSTTAMTTLRQEIADGQWGDVLAAIRRGPVADTTLFRGTSKAGLPKGGVAVGDLIDLRGLSSFTADQSYADFFAEAQDNPVLFRVKNARGLPIESISKVGPEQEWLVSGSLRVDKVTERPGVRGDKVVAWDEKTGEKTYMSTLEVDLTWLP